MGTLLVRYNSYVILKPKKEKHKKGKKKGKKKTPCKLLASESIIMYNNFLIFSKKNYGCGQKNPMGEEMG
jgi:hypothetical protein